MAVCAVGGLWLAVSAVSGLGGWRFARLAVCAVGLAVCAVGLAVCAVGGLRGWRLARLAVCGVGGWRGWRFAKLGWRLAWLAVGAVGVLWLGL